MLFGLSRFVDNSTFFIVMYLDLLVILIHHCCTLLLLTVIDAQKRPIGVEKAGGQSLLCELSHLDCNKMSAESTCCGHKDGRHMTDKSTKV